MITTILIALVGAHIAACACIVAKVLTEIPHNTKSGTTYTLCGWCRTTLIPVACANSTGICPACMHKHLPLRQDGTSAVASDHYSVRTQAPSSTGQASAKNPAGTLSQSTPADLSDAGRQSCEPALPIGNSGVISR